MIYVLITAIIIVLGDMLLIIVNNINRNKQRTFIYCPRCNNELIKNGRFIEDHHGVAKYKCSRCGTVSLFDFSNYPIPYLRSHQDCKYPIDGGFGSQYCEKDELKEFDTDKKLHF